MCCKDQQDAFAGFHKPLAYTELGYRADMTLLSGLAVFRHSCDPHPAAYVCAVPHGTLLGKLCGSYCCCQQLVVTDALEAL